MIWKTERLDYYAEDLFSGMERAMPQHWQKGYTQKNAGVLMKRTPTLDHFAVIISGGAGNGPLFPGYVGEGLADAASIGGTFSAPNAYAIYEAGKALGREHGVLLLYNNFAGDYLNNDMAQELLEQEGIRVETVISNDDICTAAGEPRENRAGRSGIALLIKLAGAYAAAGMELGEAAKRLRYANTRLGTLSVHVDHAAGQIGYGGGFSGEPPVRVETHMDMARCAQEAAELLLADLKPEKEESLFLLVNRLRLTSYADGYIMANLMVKTLEARGYRVAQLRVAPFSNIMDRYGFDFNLLCMDADTAGRMDSYICSDCFVI